MRADFKVVLDACVLANFGVCDLLLRLAEPPRLYLPQWSENILTEVRNVQTEKLGWPINLVDSWQCEVRAAFPEAMVDGYEGLIEVVRNDQKDRHVLAAAIRSQSPVIVTFNLRHFKTEALTPWSISAVHPQDYLLTLYSIEPAVVIEKLGMIAQKRNKDLQDVLIGLGKSVPAFAHHILQKLELPDEDNI